MITLNDMATEGTYWRVLGTLLRPVVWLHRMLHNSRGLVTHAVRGAVILAKQPLKTFQLNSPLAVAGFITVHLLSNLLTPLQRPERHAFARGDRWLGRGLWVARIFLHARVGRLLFQWVPTLAIMYSLSWYGALFELLNDYFPVLVCWYGPL